EARRCGDGAGPLRVGPYWIRTEVPASLAWWFESTPYHSPQHHGSTNERTRDRPVPDRDRAGHAPRADAGELDGGTDQDEGGEGRQPPRLTEPAHPHSS